MGTVKKAAKSAAIIMFFTLISKFLGFLREVMIASKFGSGWETDTYFVAMTATTLIMGLVGTALNTTLVPIFSEIEVKQGKDKKIKYMNNVLNVVFFISLLVIILGWVLSPLIIKILANGFKGEQFKLAIELNRIGLPIAVFSGGTYIFSGFLQSSQSFAAPAAVGLPFNIIYMIFLLFFSHRYGIKGLMAASVVAALSQLLIQIPSAKRLGYKYRFQFDMKDKNLRKALILVAPVLIGSAISTINTIVDKTLASGLAAGSISALNYSAKVRDIIQSVFVLSITTVIFPMLSDAFNRNDRDSAKEIMGRGIDIILLGTIPAAVGIMVLAQPMIKVFFQRGAFDSTATLMTSQALLYYSFGIVALSLRLMLNKVYYSFQDTTTPMVNGAFSVVLNVIFSLILVRFLAHGGLALGTSIAETVSVLFLIHNLKKKMGDIDTKGYVSCMSKSLLASAVMGVAVYITHRSLMGFAAGRTIYELIVLLLSVGIGVLVYLMMCYILKIDEVMIILNKVKVKTKRA